MGAALLWGFASLAAVVGGCQWGEREPDPAAPVVRQYAVNLDARYKDAITLVEALRAAVDAFVASPTADGLVACQTAWLAAHAWYGQAEYSRFYGGPIDQVQVGMNEWPLDENFIDSTIGNPDGGIVNDPADFPQITATVITGVDQRGIETITTGFHAIEFLLWGQRADQSEGPGTRPYTDYVDGGTADNQDRRRAYLQVATAVLDDDLHALDAQWDLTRPASYGALLVAGKSSDGLAKIFRGLSQMSISELYYERMYDPATSRDRKDEESCFSESTYADLVANALGVEDAYLGRYVARDGTILQGPSISDLVAARDVATDAELRKELAAVRAAIGAIPPPFDHAVLAPADSPANMAVEAALTVYQPVQATFDEAAGVLGVTNNL
jgi:putative iron-regulated protein